VVRGAHLVPERVCQTSIVIHMLACVLRLACCQSEQHTALAAGSRLCPWFNGAARCRTAVCLCYSRQLVGCRGVYKGHLLMSLSLGTAVASTQQQPRSCWWRGGRRSIPQHCRMDFVVRLSWHTSAWTSCSSATALLPVLTSALGQRLICCMCSHTTSSHVHSLSIHDVPTPTCQQ
jgi:hypothetical protein